MENNFDKSFKDRLEGHRSKMDLYKFWSELEPKLPPQKKRRRFLFWILLPLIIGLVSLLSWYMNRTNSAISESTLTDNSSYSAQKVSELPNTSNDKPINQISNSESKGESSTNFSVNSKSSSLKNDLEYKNNNEALIHNEKISSISKINSTLSNELINTNEKIIASSTSTENQQKIDNEKISPTSSAINIDRTTSKHKEDIVQVHHTNKNLPELDLNLGTHQDSVKISIDSIQANETIETNSTLQAKILDSISSQSTSFVESTNSEISKSKSSIFTYYIRPEFGIGIFNKIYNSNDSDQVNYMKIRRQLESNLEEIYSGISLGLKWNKLTLESGIQYTQKNERFEFFQSRTENKFGLTTIHREYINGNNDTIRGDEWSSTSYSRKVVHYNKIKSINIPLRFTFDLYQKNKLSLGLNGGLLFSLNNTMTGRSINDSILISEINKIQISPVVNKLGIGMNMGIHIRYKIRRNTELYYSVQYQKFGKSYLEGPFRLNYESVYLNLGLQLSF